MRSTFYGLNIARSGLFMSQKQLDVTGHNISNANTDGYSRQRIVQQGIDPYGYQTRLALLDDGRVGGGVMGQGVTQIRNAFIDRQYRLENSLASTWNTRSRELGYVEKLFNEISDTNSMTISTVIKSFYNSLQELQKQPEDISLRKNVQTNGENLAAAFNHFYRQLFDIQTEYNDTVKDLTTEVNNIAQSIAAYDMQIYGYEISGEKANDLRDKRNVLIDELSSLVNINYTETDGMMKIYIGDVKPENLLVDHITYNKLDISETIANNIPGEADLLYDVVWASSGTSVELRDGSLKAYIDLRDGNTSTVQGIPYFLKALNDLASAIVTEVNNQHKLGYNIANSTTGGNSVSGLLFFDDTPPITAKSIQLSQDIKNSEQNIAASDKPVVFGSDINGYPQIGNSVNMVEIIKLFDTYITSLNGTFDSYLKAAVVNVATEKKRADDMSSSQIDIMDNLTNNRLSISGVDIDEEVINMITFQQAYAAASRVLTTMDEMLDILINRTGMVGR